MKYYKLDEEERKLLENFEKGEFMRVKNFETEKRKAITIAKNTRNRIRNINSSGDGGN